jgi:hypothetical protein
MLTGKTYQGRQMSGNTGVMGGMLRIAVAEVVLHGP